MGSIENLKRKSNIEVLRIISMILIVLQHYAVHGGLLNNTIGTNNKFIAGIIFIGGQIGVNIFILITGYFSINSEFKIKKIIKLWMQIVFYTIICLIFNVIFLDNNIQWLDLVKTFFPISFGTYWFITTYAALYLLSPFINKFFKAQNKQQIEKLIIILLFLLSLVGWFTKKNGFMGKLQWFIYLYILGAYIRVYDFNKFNFLKKSITPIIGYLFLIFVFCIVILFTSKNNLYLLILNRLIEMNSIFIIIESLLIFFYIKSVNIKYHSFINILGKASIGVYLFHDNFLIRDYIWNIFLKTEDFCNINSVYLMLHIIGSVIIIYSIGTLIECIRINLIEKNFFSIRGINEICEKIDNKILMND